MKNKSKKKSAKFSIGSLIKIKLYSIMDEISEYSSYIPAHDDGFDAWGYGHGNSSTWYSGLGTSVGGITVGTTTDMDVLRQPIGKDSYKYSKVEVNVDTDTWVNDVLGEKDNPNAAKEVEFTAPQSETTVKDKLEVDDITENNSGANWNLDQSFTAGKVTYKPAAYDKKDLNEIKADLQTLALKQYPKALNPTPISTTLSGLDNDTNLIGYKSLKDAVDGKVERLSVENKKGEAKNLKHVSGIIVDKFNPVTVVKSEKGEEVRIRAGKTYGVTFKEEGILYKVLFGQDKCMWVREKDLSLLDKDNQDEE